MNLNEFLSHPDLQLPCDWNSHTDFEAFVGQRLETFASLLDKLDAHPVTESVKRRREAINTCRHRLLKALQASLKGHTPEAYQHFNHATHAILTELNALAIEVDRFTSLGILYRVRKTESQHLTAADLFHIPFELRHLVATQRYSIPGLPCLYLSGSIYTCWEEMGRPPFHELHCTALWVKANKTMKIIDLSERPYRLKLLLNRLEFEGSANLAPTWFAQRIILWPLLFASSIKVKHRTAPFKPEYIIPQMTLQWVTQNHGFDGLVYFSTHVRAICKARSLPACNIVVPAKKVTATGRCEYLCDTFKMTDPINWQLLSSINIQTGTAGANVPTYDFEFLEGFEEPYHQTAFGVVQTNLNKLVAHIRQENGNGNETLGDVSPT